MAARVMAMPDSAVQRQTMEEEEGRLQTKPLLQRQEMMENEDEEPLRAKSLVQRQEISEEEDEETLQTKPQLQREEMPEEDEEETLQTKPLLQREVMPEEEEEENLQAKSLLQRQTIPEEKEEGTLQTKPQIQAKNGALQAPDNFEGQLAQHKGTGQPLSDETRAFMEPRFGADFSNVRIHETPDLAGAIQAQAFTHGQDIYFNSGKYKPGSSGGKELLAHELTHVIQQSHNTYNKSLTSRSELVNSITPATNFPIQTFAPTHHQTATVIGLANDFSSEEIGAIYQSNWERDFSQGHYGWADLVLSWKEYKKARKNDPKKFPASALWELAQNLWNVLKELGENPKKSLFDYSMGGYNYWEHMDNPEDNKRKNSDSRWAKNSSKLPGYINDSKTYIKDQMVSAVNAYRIRMRKPKIKSIDNWGEVRKPEGYSINKLEHSAEFGDSDSPKLDRGIIAEEAANLARNTGAKSRKQNRANKDAWRIVGYHLGRAMHATEDFFAHSNWVEIAQHMGFISGLDSTSSHKLETTKSNTLKTGTFENYSKAHALGHKLISLSQAMATDQYIKILLNTELIKLRLAGEALKLAEHQAPDNSHAKLAKDQPEHGKMFDEAFNFAVLANNKIFAPLRSIMDEKDPDVVYTALNAQLAMVDEIIYPPHLKHPLLEDKIYNSTHQEDNIDSSSENLEASSSNSNMPTHSSSQPEEETLETYIVKRGDSLSKIAQILYGDTSRWRIIYELNKDIVEDPNLIFPGQKLKLPQND